MSSRERRVEREEWRFRRDLQDLGQDLRTARLSAGLTLSVVAKAAGVSAQTILRNERPGRGAANPLVVARQAAAVGMRVRIKAYPEGAPIRDAAQVALIRKLRERIGPGAQLLLEQPVTALTADRRAFDATLDIGTGCALEFITRFHDCQAQLRTVILKQRDSGIARLIVVVKETHANRRAVASVSDVISTTFPVSTRVALRALAAAKDPGGNSLVFL